METNLESAVYEFDVFRIDGGKRLLWKSGEQLEVKPKVFDTLFYLVRNAGSTVSKEELMAAIWPDTVVEENNLNKNISALRQALGEKPGEHRFIATVPGRGYRFVAAVKEKEPSPAVSENAAAGPVSASEPPATIIPDQPAPIWRRSWKVWTALGILALVGFFLVRSWLRQSPKPSARRVMLAVLPFKNLSGDLNQEYIVDGLTEEILTDLGRMSPEQMGVIARTSAMAYKNTDKTVSQIGRELGVDYVLEGSVRSEGGKARVSAQLIRVSDQTHLWAKNYDGSLENLLEFEDELGQKLTQELGQSLAHEMGLTLSSGAETEVARMRTRSAEAYDLYLKGRFYWNQRTPPAMKQSIESFQQAIEKDPEFALAYAGLAEAYNLSYNMGLYSAKESSLKAKDAATRALELDPSIAEAHAALGKVKSHYDFDFPGAEKEFLKALELNPNSPTAHFFYANSYLLPMGRMAEAIAENKKALELDPLSMPLNTFLGHMYAWARDYDKSYEQFQRTIKMNPSFPMVHVLLSGVLEYQGRYKEAIREFEKSQLLMGVSPAEAAEESARRLDALEKGGEEGYYQYFLQNMLKGRQRDPSSRWPTGGASSPTGVAKLYAKLGDKDNAFLWLDRAYEEREGQILTLLKVDPPFDSLRSDPRYGAFLRKMGLPE